MNIKSIPTPNFYSLDGEIEGIVLHTTLGSYKSAVSWLTSPRSSASAHYVMGRLGEQGGELAQLVDLDKGAWHAGRINHPTDRGKKLLKRDAFGRYKNPNKYLVGFEVASGYDVDRDGILESWEKQYSTYQIKDCARLILHVEDILNKTFADWQIITHRDIAIDKPNLDLMRAMVLAELRKLRAGEEPEPTPQPTPPSDASGLKVGETYRIEHKNGEVQFIKV